MKSKILYLFFLLLFSLNGLSQITEADWAEVLPPSPAASELGKAGLVNSHLASGIANIQIPLFNFSTKDLALQISLSYSGNGLKVDQTASRVGMGWMLNAGGVINRTVYGNPDNGNWANIPADFPSTTGEALKNFVNSVVGSDYETEPDVFSYSFAGHSGRFILVNQKFIKLEENNLVISGDLNGFEIKTPEGVIYKFNAIESSRSLNLGTFYNKTDIKNAWFLTSVTHPGGDTIYLRYNNCEFFYLAGVSQMFTYREASEGSCGSTQCPVLPAFSENSSYLRNSGVYVSQISSNRRSSGVLKFNYSSRTDLPGDYFLQSVRHYDAMGDRLGDITYYNDFPTKVYNLSYALANSSSAFGSGYMSNHASVTKRIFLTGLSDEVKSYNFEYDRMNDLPPRLSFSQDGNGLFNGELNRSLIPMPKTKSQHVNAFSSYGFGERRPNWNYSKRGMLTKIIYPTGGVDSLIYEANSVYVNSPPDCANPDFTAYLFKAASSVFKQTTTTYSEVFNFACPQTVPLTVACRPTNDAYPYANYRFTVDLADPDFQTSSPLFDSGSGYQVTAGKGEEITFYVHLPAGRHRLALKVLGPTEGYASFSYNSSLAFEGNKEVSGVRVAKVLSYDPITHKTNIKKNYYNDPVTGRSTGVLQNNQFDYESPVKSFIRCEGETSIPCLLQICNYTRYFSSDVIGLNDMVGNHIGYRKVTEGYGEDFENGGVEHTYDIRFDGFAATRLGNPVPSAPFSNFGMFSGLESNQKTFKKLGADYITLKNVRSTYKYDSRKQTEYKFYAFRKDAGYGICNIINNINDYKGLNIAEYLLYSRWMYKDSTITTAFDINGLNPITTLETDIYLSDVHKQISANQTALSNGKSKKLIYKYPHDMVSAGKDLDGIYQEMINGNIISPQIETIALINDQQINLKRTNYYRPFTGIYVPRSIETQQATSSPTESRVKFHNYDIAGNLLSVSKEHGAVESYLWGYGGQFPIAKIENASYAEIENAVGVPAIEAMHSNSNPTNQAVLSFVESLKGALPKAYVTTYTYDPKVGVISSVDAKGMTTYYEYDEFQRLANVKDQNLNIVKNFQYHFRIPELPPMVYTNAMQSQIFTKNSCTQNEIGGQYTYTVLANTYSSTISQSDADNKALEDIALNGQNAANFNATCTPIPCGGSGKKVIDGVCEAGFKVYTSSTKVGTHGDIYNCIYHWEWSDGSRGPDINEDSHRGPCPVLN